MRRLLPRVLQIFLILGVVCLTSFRGVGEAYAAGDNDPKTTKEDKPTDPPAPTDPPKPTKPPNTHVPTYKTDVPADTPIPTDTDDPFATSTNTPDCSPFSLTPTVSGIPGLPTCTPTPTQTGTDVPADTAQPGGPTFTPKPTNTLPPTVTAALLLIPTASTALSGMDSAATIVQAMPGASATQSSSPTSNPASISGSGNSTGSNPFSNAKAMSYLSFLATLAMGGAVIFAFTTRGRREIYNPSPGAGATMAIHPATVGASGFSAWLAEQAPLLTDGEKVVLSKVGNGILSALHLSGRISDLTRISEGGPQEFLQLAAGS